jgi:hypothetical protein
LLNIRIRSENSKSKRLHFRRSKKVQSSDGTTHWGREVLNKSRKAQSGNTKRGEKMASEYLSREKIHAKQVNGRDDIK